MAELIHQSSEFKSESPQRTRRAQSIAAIIFAVFAPSAVKEEKEPQINADMLKGYLQLIVFFSCY